MDPRVNLRGRAGPESEGEGEEEFQDSREEQPLRSLSEPPPIPALAQVRSVSEGHPNVATQGESACDPRGKAMVEDLV